jgi:hypothetical protein
MYAKRISPLYLLMVVLAFPATIHAAAVDLLSVTDSFSGSSKTYTVPVDASAMQLKVTVSGASSIVIKRPDGSTVGASDTGVTTGATAAGTIYVINSPATGDWSITVNGAGGFTLTVSGQASLSVSSFRFVASAGRPGHESFATAPGNPVAGVATTVQAQLTPGYSTANVQLRTPAGSVLDTQPLSLPDPSQNDFFGIVTPPNAAFLVYVVGMDTNTKSYQRLMSGSMQGQNFIVTPPFATDLTASTMQNVVFKVTNFGPSVNLTFNATDEKSYVASVNSPTTALQMGDTVDVTVQLSVPAAAVAGTSDKLTLVAQNAGDATQKNSASVTNPVVAVSVVAVPDVLGLDEAAAEAKIAGANLIVGKVDAMASGSVQSGSVISQNPAGGTNVSAGSTVDIVISFSLPAITVRRGQITSQ